jgi:hypothetical protein
VKVTWLLLVCWLCACSIYSRVLKNSSVILISAENVGEFFIFLLIRNDIAGKDFQVFFCFVFARRPGQFGVSCFRQRCEYFLPCKGYFVSILFLNVFNEKGLFGFNIIFKCI